jgi:hypothetical protein
MAFRVRVLHSLLLGLAGFSLVLCSFFYATPVALRYGEPAAALAPVAQDATSTNSATAQSTLAIASSERVVEEGTKPELNNIGR